MELNGKMDEGFVVIYLLMILIDQRKKIINKLAIQSYFLTFVILNIQFTCKNTRYIYLLRPYKYLFRVRIDSTIRSQAVDC